MTCLRLICTTIALAAVTAVCASRSYADPPAAPTGGASAINTLTADEQKAGWKLLFDGKTTNGWRNYKKKDISPNWKVIDGALTCAGAAGDIVTTDKYASFEISLDYKISRAGNSGLMFHVAEDQDASWQTGPEIQILDNKEGDDTQKSGWLYELYKPEVDATKPAGEWNQLRVIVTPQKCETYMNGVKYYEFVKGSKDWDERVAKSKFGKMPRFGKPTSGYICLQDHHYEVAFRNIKIRPIQ